MRRARCAHGGHRVTHDALRLRFDLVNMMARPSDPGPEEPYLTVHPPEADLTEEVAAVSHAALDLAAGPVFRADLLPGSPARLLLIAHHLVIDVVSWQIIVSDLSAALRQQGTGDPPHLPPVPTSWLRWTRRLNGWAQSDQAAEQARWWLRPRRLTRQPACGCRPSSRPASPVMRT